ncbi:MAG: hypothetical protein PF518_00925 [Spirochaetaceae bacterium]|nr:hypothetical protein [Spirochaetaceae bacterium]
MSENIKLIIGFLLFAEKLALILSNPENLKTVGQKAKESLYRPWDQIATIVYEKYNEIVDQYKYEHLRKIFEG